MKVQEKTKVKTEQAAMLKRKGLTYEQISEEMGVSERHVGRLLRRDRLEHMQEGVPQ
jgi:orotate phosphoribosyltransferase-like protein